MSNIDEEQQEDHLVEDEMIQQMVKDLIAKDFSDLATANIGVVVKEQSKQTISKNPSKIYLCKPSDRFYHGKDYIMEIERNVIRALNPLQLENLVFRTLCRAYLNDKGVFAIQPPEFSFFKGEVSKYGEEGLFDLMELIKTVREKVKTKNKNAPIEPEESFDDFQP